VPDAISKTLPSGTKAGTVCDAPVNLLCFYPTLLDLCDLPPKSDNDGPSLLPLLRNSATKDWQTQSVTYLSEPDSYAVSGRTHRYIHLADGSEELYNIKLDPYEWTNLASQESSTSLLVDFHAAAPKGFAKRVEPSVKSLAKLDWVPAVGAPIPLSKPDGNPFPVYFINKRRMPVEIFWMSSDNTPKSYGIIEPGSRKEQQTRPGAVWMIQDTQTSKPLGHFVVGDQSTTSILAAHCCRSVHR